MRADTWRCAQSRLASLGKRRPRAKAAYSRGHGASLRCVAQDAAGLGERRVGGAVVDPVEPARSRRDVSAPLRVALVNNMAEGAFGPTHERFVQLLGGAGTGAGVELRGYVITDGPEHLAARRLGYEPIESLYADPPHAMVVTGAEPTTADLTAEWYWARLARLVAWAEATLASTMLSCLAAHAAVLALDGVARRRLPRKLTGVVAAQVGAAHLANPLVAGLGRNVAFAHSRWHDVAPGALAAHGYDVLASSPRGGWSIAARARGGRLLVLLQGHPEYGPLTLLGEYRRDVERFVRGVAATYPEMPSGYLDKEGIGLLTRLRGEHLAQGGGGGRSALPVEEVGRHVVASWEPAAARLFANWVADARRRVAGLAA